ncbi:MAG: nucleoside triphosphate pyrophosphohydrolase [Bacillota bacterium]
MTRDTLIILGLTALNPAHVRDRERRILRSAGQVLVPSEYVAEALSALEIDAPLTVDDGAELDRSRGRVLYCSPGSPIPNDAAAVALERRAAVRGIEIEVIQGPPVSSGLGSDLPRQMRASAPAIGPGLTGGIICPFDDIWVESLWSASDLAKIASLLTSQYPPSHPLAVVTPGALASGWRTSQTVRDCPVRTLTVGSFAGGFALGGMDLVYVPQLPLEGAVRGQLVEAGQAMAGLMGVVHRLRGPGGCPWDREQTHDSLRPFLLEECHELMDALASGRPDRIRDELGDVLLQVLLHSVIAGESEDFAIGDVMAGLFAKMVRRHPHVFAGARADSAADVEASWERIKREQREDEDKREASILAGVPSTLPALLQAEKVQSVVSRVGFDWEDAAGPVAKIREEVEEFACAADSSERGRELGDLLFSLVNLSRFLSLSPETELLGTISRFRGRFEAIERRARRKGLKVEDMSLEEMDRIWDEHKACE